MTDRAKYRAYQSEQVHAKAFDRELIGRLLGYLHPYRHVLALSILFLFISKVVEASVPIFIGHVSQRILDAIHMDSAGKDALFDNVLQACFYIIALLVMSYLFDSVNVIVKSWAGQKALYKLRMDVYRHIMRLPLGYFDKHTVGRLMTRTIHDVDQINQMFAESVVPIMGNSFLFVGIFVGMWMLDWHIAVLTSVLLPLLWWLTNRFRKQQRICYDRARTVVAALNTFVQEHLMGASTIRGFGLHKRVQQGFEEINEDHCEIYLESIKNFSFFISSIDLLQNVSLISAFVLIVLFASPEKGFEAGTYFSFSLYVLMVFRPLADLAERYNLLQSAMSAAVRIFDVLDTPSEAVQDTGKVELEAIQAVVFDRVWFAYADEQWVLKGVSFEMREGESAALVAMTGEGKSTIISLLLRFYECQKGTIAINGRSIRDYTLDSLRRQFSLVLQDPVIFSGTIAENITLFDPALGSQRAEQAIDYLNMRPYLDRFAGSVDHHLGERGKSLSVGEMQLLSMARAVAHRCSMFVLDEATANIDGATEKVIQDALKKMLSHRTALIIAHRLSTIQDVQRIFVLQGGQVVEQGTHAALLAAKGAYEKLYRLQFS